MPRDMLSCDIAMPQNLPPSPESERRFTVILWAVMLLSVLMYFVVVRLARPENPTDDPRLVRTLLVIAAGFIVASFLARNRFELRARDDGKPALRRVGLLVGLVLCEAAALVGVVVWFVTGSPLYYWFLLMGVAGILLHYPKPAE